jgi:hypothetical protein
VQSKVASKTRVTGCGRWLAASNFVDATYPVV